MSHSPAGKYLTFALGNEEFGIPVTGVREIMGAPEITTVPYTPPFVKGVINLRGKVMPVIDLRLKFGMAECVDIGHACVVVVQIENNGSNVLTGLVVDEVCEVVNLQASQIEETPQFGSGVSAPHVLGIAKSKRSVTILLDTNLIVTLQELQQLPSAA
jgi:purine-binding chemotaxis protein CheW